MIFTLQTASSWICIHVHLRLHICIHIYVSRIFTYLHAQICMIFALQTACLWPVKTRSRARKRPRTFSRSSPELFLKFTSKHSTTLGSTLQQAVSQLVAVYCNTDTHVFQQTIKRPRTCSGRTLAWIALDVTLQHSAARCNMQYHAATLIDLFFNTCDNGQAPPQDPHAWNFDLNSRPKKSPQDPCLNVLELRELQSFTQK